MEFNHLAGIVFFLLPWLFLTHLLAQDKIPIASFICFAAALFGFNSLIQAILCGL